MPGPTAGMLVVFGLVVAAMVLFVSEAIPTDTTALALVVALVVLGEYTLISPAEALSGFSSSATITILAMYVLSAGVQNTGIVRRLGTAIARVTRGSKTRLLTVVVGITSVLAGFINNTPVVAVFTPMVTELGERAHVSPSKLLLPLSYASMLGGTLTLIGTATNVVASDLAAGLSDTYPELHPYSMFEFTLLGAVVTLIGGVYLLTVGQWLIPERIAVVDLTEKYGLGEYLARVYVPRDSPVVGRTIASVMAETAGVTADRDGRGPGDPAPDAGDAVLEAGDAVPEAGSGPVDPGPGREGEGADAGPPGPGRPDDREGPAGAVGDPGTDAGEPTVEDGEGGPPRSGTGGPESDPDPAAVDDGLDLDVVQVVRGEDAYVAPSTDRTIEAGDVLTVRADGAALRAFVDALGLRRLPRAPVTEAELADPGGRGSLVEVVVPPDSGLAGQTIRELRFRERYADTVLAVRRGGDLIREGLADVSLSPGDSLLLHGTTASIETIRESGELSITEEAAVPGDDEAPEVSADAPLAVGIVVGVVALAAVGSLPISIAALAGVVAMVVTGVIAPSEAYDAVSWEIVFLLAGVFPLGLAMQETGAAAFLGELIVDNAGFLPAVAVLALFYLLTGLLANVITPVASVVLVFPVAVGAAAGIGADPFAFALGVTFAGSTAFMTPVGYQTNLMVYGPGGYRFTDYLRVGGPLQLLLTLVTPLMIDVIWTV